MTEPRFSSDRMVTLLGGGLLPPGDLEMALGLAPSLICADGGADPALAQGVMPDAVIGDFDSISPAARATIPAERQHEIAEQETTDFDKCLTHVEAPGYLGLGFVGGRLDHQLAVLSGLARRPDRRCVLLGESDVVFLAPARLDLSLAPGTRMSLFPMGPVTGQSRGLRWPIDGLEFTPSGRIGTSNIVDAPRVELSFGDGQMVVLLPRDALGAVLAGLGLG